MEKKVFTKPAVAGQLKRVVESRVHNDLENQDEVRAWQNEMIHTFATPSYALVQPSTGEVIAMHEGPQMDATIYAEWLKAAIDKWERTK